MGELTVAYASEFEMIRSKMRASIYKLNEHALVSRKFLLHSVMRRSVASFGMTYLSSDAMREARKFMNADQKGVRDEIGFLIVHQRYADRFFPGTSVLHTRLRYVLFVPWLYRDEQAKPAKGQRTQDSMKRREYLLTGRLMNEPFGVIGIRNYPFPVEQRPSQVYWGALQRWGMVREQEGTGPLSRYQVERIVSGKAGGPLKDDEGTLLNGMSWPFVCPEPPEEWYQEGEGTLSFDLTAKEKKFLAKRLRSLTSPKNPGARSIFSLLVGQDVSSSRTAWSPQIRDLAESERPALERAGRAAALAAIGRAVYAAQVETLCDTLDGSKCSSTQRDALPKILERWRVQADRLDWAAFLEDMQDKSEFSPVVSVALGDTLSWIRAGHSDPMRLEAVYRDAEIHRKGRRARLSRNQFGLDLRANWDNDHHPRGEPLHYRWDRVQMLLRDLVGE